jgi:hypothetical protein
MRSNLVVVTAPLLDADLSFDPIPKPLQAQIFVSQLSVERSPPTPPPAPQDKAKNKRARKGQSGPDGNSAETKVPDFVKEAGSPHWTISATG